MLEKELLFSNTFPQCRQQVSADTWRQLVALAASPEDFAVAVQEKAAALELPPYLGELAVMEHSAAGLSADKTPVPRYAEKLIINPTLQLFDNSWKNLAFLLDGTRKTPRPEHGKERVIAWKHPETTRVMIRPASRDDLLAMKIALEELDIAAVAQEGGVHASAVASVLIRALEEGLVVGPEPRVRRHYRPEDYADIDHSFYAARIFSLQWHITQACDLHCRHCYDRNQYQSLSLEQEIGILDDLARFCAAHNVHGQVTFTGGNPLLHPNFETLYREASKRGFTLAILGNPASREQIERLLAIQPPAFYQISLEGLERHNDYIRGRGHFRRALSFLDMLRECNIFSMVMLTLTRDNMAEILPLAETLRHRTDLFTFNRLSTVGEGANLASADIAAYHSFLQDYIMAAADNPCLGLKDNLLNIVNHRQNLPLFGGCTGFGCGAAFNFITVLADGAVHACRKFPSPLGNILDNSLSEIYHSTEAERYRRGPDACNHCPIRPVCGGCLAVAHSHGVDVFKQKDPYCFFDAEAPAG